MTEQPQPTGPQPVPDQPEQPQLSPAAQAAVQAEQERTTRAVQEGLNRYLMERNAQLVAEIADLQDEVAALRTQVADAHDEIGTTPPPPQPTPARKG